MNRRTELRRATRSLRGCSVFAVAAGILCAAASAADTHQREIAWIEGRVFLDSDADGRRDADEPGRLGVKVSNGREIATTDADGRYRLPLQDGDTLFVIRPPDAELPRGGDGLPMFWKHHFPTGSPSLRYAGIAPAGIVDGDFALLPAAQETSGKLTISVFGDPQVSNARELDWFERDIIEPLLSVAIGDVGISLGDIANDDLSVYPGIKRAMARLGIPWLHLPGNHDLDFDAADDARSLLSWRAAFGPDTYAWEDRDASLILLDDVIYRPGEKPAYVGGLREDQFVFLEAYLATLPRDRRVIVAAHIPFHDKTPGVESFRRADRERLFALLQPFPRVLLLTGHAHAQRHYFHVTKDGWRGTEPLHEYVVGTACGGFWSGLPDAQGIPDARMDDGTPNGHATLALQDGSYRLRWHVARDPADPRMALHAPRVLRRGAYPAFAVSANVFMGMDDTRVEYRVDDGPWLPMTRAVRADPALLAINAMDDLAPQLRSFDRAVEAAPSTHLWRGALPTDLAVGEHRVEVRAFDRWDGEVRAHTSYRLDAFDPPP
jgi:hypothetical protein